MTVAVVTGSAGLVGSESVKFLVDRGLEVAGIDNDMRRTLFGNEASTAKNREHLEALYPTQYRHYDIDIRDEEAVASVFKRYGAQIDLIIHTAAQPSHEWAAKAPMVDFAINATGTLVVLEATRRYCPDATFVFTSTNKVYGDTPNTLPLVERKTRWEIDPDHDYQEGIPEDLGIDMTMHSIFGASKVAADVLVQEYGRYYDLNTGTFRGGCLTGPNHTGTELHGFLAYLMRCVCTGKPYTIFGYKGKQVRDNIHSSDLVQAFFEFYLEPRPGEVYNIGGSRHSNCSILEAIKLSEEIASRALSYEYSHQNRMGDHVWYISDVRKFRDHYPAWSQSYNVRQILEDIYERNIDRWSADK